VRGTRLKEQGPLLVTHWGVSGPGILKLSAWGARELAAMDYKFALVVNFSPGHTRETLVKELAAAREKNLKKQVTTWSPVAGVPQRFGSGWWRRRGSGDDTVDECGQCGVVESGDAGSAAEFAVSGRARTRTKFVTCGGVRLREVDFRTMKQPVCPGLHFAGEVLDIDGVTGGFNFQAAWTTGWLAGRAMAGCGEAGI